MKSFLLIALIAAPLSSMAQTTTNNNSSTVVDSRSIYVPSITPPALPSQSSIGNILMETSECGPLQQVVKTPIEGTFQGLFKSNKVQQGFTYELAPYTDSEGRIQFYKEVPLRGQPGSFSIVGHQVVTSTTVVGVASMRNIALGGASSSGSWGQAGGGGSIANSQLVTNIQLRSCELGSIVRNRPITFVPEADAYGQAGDK